MVVLTDPNNPVDQALAREWLHLHEMRNRYSTTYNLELGEDVDPEEYSSPVASGALRDVADLLTQGMRRIEQELGYRMVANLPYMPEQTA
jgi:hypothetical protein